MKSFDVPVFYRSPLIGKIKNIRNQFDPKKRSLAPTELDLGSVKLSIARHFGFCYGVENAIEISYKALEENPDKRIFLLSQMIHNPDVNGDLLDRGLRFIQDTEGNMLIDWDELNSDDLVIIPAFGTTVEIENLLEEKGIQTSKYDTTCPFVTRVWKKAAKLGDDNYTVIIHGKHEHEETRATFSHARKNAPALVVKDLAEAKKVGEFILGKRSLASFEAEFNTKVSANFNPEKDLEKVGVVNQTTMLASDTQEIADYFKQIMLEKYGEENLKSHFADTRDTLCYATNENQGATSQLMEETNPDMAIIVGGYNSSNTSHLLEICEKYVPSFFINSENEIQDKDSSYHFNLSNKQRELSQTFIPNKDAVNIAITSGASCPDAVVDRVIEKILSFFPDHRDIDQALEELEASLSTS